MRDDLRYEWKHVLTYKYVIVDVFFSYSTKID